MKKSRRIGIADPDVPAAQYRQPWGAVRPELDPAAAARPQHPDVVTVPLDGAPALIGERRDGSQIIYREPQRFASVIKPQRRGALHDIQLVLWIGRPDPDPPPRR